MSRYDIPSIENVRSHRFAKHISYMCSKIRNNGIVILEKNEENMEFINEYILNHEDRFFVIANKTYIYLIDKTF
ncbi:MAG: hypothetical protein KatS3mg002_1336 [Candidatus Woesearchaeota archaeon]|nr:MAG: hypothetical protein KatS3mg002_1336 [Candidatus Woesearchaeota archaeon]